PQSGHAAGAGGARMVRPRPGSRRAWLLHTGAVAPAHHSGESLEKDVLPALLLLAWDQSRHALPAARTGHGESAGDAARLLPRASLVRDPSIHVPNGGGPGARGREGVHARQFPGRLRSRAVRLDVPWTGAATMARSK